MRHLTQKQEQFCLNYIKMENAAEAARQAGYSLKWANYNTTHILEKPLVQARLKELRQKAEDDSVMTLLERKQRLSEIGRAKLTDFMEMGPDGSWVNVGPETEKSAAIQELHSRTEYDKDSAKTTVHTSVKLHDPVRAIDLLNKIDNIYSDGPRVNFQQNIVFVIGEGYRENGPAQPDIQPDQPDPGRICSVQS